MGSFPASNLFDMVGVIVRGYGFCRSWSCVKRPARVVSPFVSLCVFAHTFLLNNTPFPCHPSLLGMHVFQRDLKQICAERPDQRFSVARLPRRGRRRLRCICCGSLDATFAFGFMYNKTTCAPTH